MITDKERKAFMKDFPDMKSNVLATEVTDNINQEEQEKLFDVEKVIKMRVKKGKEEFLVKWAGYPLSQATWEPFENLLGDDACEYPANSIQEMIHLL